MRKSLAKILTFENSHEDQFYGICEKLYNHGAILEGYLRCLFSKEEIRIDFKPLAQN
jgi:hypothetical protein